VPIPSRLMNEGEREICGRLRDLREQVGWSQTEFAHALGTTRDQLASIEYERNPLRYWLADRVCEKLDVCQRWLACGAGQVKGYVALPSEIGLEIKPRELFSSAWTRRIAHLVQRRMQDVERMKRVLEAHPDAANKLLVDRLYNLALLWFDRIPPGLYDDYFGELNAISSAFFWRHQNEMLRLADKRSPAPSENGRQESLDNGKALAHNSDVKSEICSLSDLIAELRKLTVPRGVKAALARELKVSRQAVDQWLSGASSPSGETAIRLLNWIRQQKRQTK